MKQSIFLFHAKKIYVAIIFSLLFFQTIYSELSSMPLSGCSSSRSSSIKGKGRLELSPNSKNNDEELEQISTPFLLPSDNPIAIDEMSEFHLGNNNDEASSSNQPPFTHFGTSVNPLVFPLATINPDIAEWIQEDIILRLINIVPDLSYLALHRINPVVNEFDTGTSTVTSNVAASDITLAEIQTNMNYLDAIIAGALRTGIKGLPTWIYIVNILTYDPTKKSGVSYLSDGWLEKIGIGTAATIISLKYLISFGKECIKEFIFTRYLENLIKRDASNISCFQKTLLVTFNFFDYCLPKLFESERVVHRSISSLYRMITQGMALMLVDYWTDVFFIFLATGHNSAALEHWKFILLTGLFLNPITQFIPKIISDFILSRTFQPYLKKHSNSQSCGHRFIRTSITLASCLINVYLLGLTFAEPFKKWTGKMFPSHVSSPDQCDQTDKYWFFHGPYLYWSLWKHWGGFSTPWFEVITCSLEE